MQKPNESRAPDLKWLKKVLRGAEAYVGQMTADAEKRLEYMRGVIAALDPKAKKSRRRIQRAH